MFVDREWGLGRLQEALLRQVGRGRLITVLFSRSGFTPDLAALAGEDLWLIPAERLG
jgi:hypothetical protein